jgi:hypothetical protein
MRSFGRWAWVLLFFLSGADLSANISRTVEHVFPFAPGEIPLVKMEVFYGSVMVEAAEGDAVRIEVKLDFDTDQEAVADRVQKNLTLAFARQGGVVTVGAEYSRSVHWDFENWPPVKPAFKLLVPARCNLDLYTRDGNLMVGLLGGAMKARTHYGAITFRGVQGSIEAQSEFGDITVQHCTGALKLRSVSGNFRVGPVGGFADVFGYGGEIEVQSAGGGIKAETSGADLLVGFAHPVTAPATLRTGGANVILTFDERSACTLDLRASIFGKVVNVKDRLKLTPTSGAFGKSRLKATLNGGGPQIVAKASGGYVYVQAAVPSEGQP